MKTDVIEETEGKKTMRVTPIKNGIVIDHIPSGRGMLVLKILDLPGLAEGSIISAVMNVPSKKAKLKDIIKIEDKTLEPQELDIVSLIAPDATINVIKNFQNVKKYKVHHPETIKGIIRCGNPNCITNQMEPVSPSFDIKSRKPLVLKCKYCERKLTDIFQNIIR